MASQLFHLEERTEGKTAVRAEMDVLTTQLRGKKDSLLAWEKEIKALRLKVRSQEEVQELVATDCLFERAVGG